MTRIITVTLTGEKQDIDETVELIKSIEGVVAE